MRPSSQLPSVAVAVLTSMAVFCRAEDADHHAELGRRQNLGGVATTSTPIAGADTATDTGLAPTADTLTAADTTDTAVLPGTETPTHAPTPTPTTTLQQVPPTTTTPTPAAPTTTHTNPPAQATTTTPLATTTPTPKPTVTSKTTPPADTTSTTSTTHPPGGMGAAGGGGGAPPANTSPAPANVITATQGSGGILDYGSCVEFESQCNSLCSYGIYSMNCVDGGICLCYDEDPNATTDSDGSEVDGSDTSISGASGSYFAQLSIWGISATALPALAALAVTGAFF
ncbi:hypothetical protein IWW36_002109 [Coemansia brasiliensis]|uniref:Uncharacterized protein n=1 Tax=Coemansia brasiliensis TaxID=2650707 RepID=A0A9W8I7N6_9FUNG|nr:hypothetical protein IWW36_002109 [Coemansia brasiliensis]